MSTFFSYVFKPKFRGYPNPPPLVQLALKKEKKKGSKKSSLGLPRNFTINMPKLVGGGGGGVASWCINVLYIQYLKIINAADPC